MSAKNFMTRNPDFYLDRFLFWWGKTSVRLPWLVLLVFMTLAGIALNLAIQQLGINTDTSEMLSPDLPFQKVRRRLAQTFPQDSGSVMLVIDANTPEQASAAVRDLGNRLSSENTLVKSLYIPGEGKFFDKNGLLYLELDDLEDLATELSRAQPFIGTLAQDYSLGGLLSILGYAVEHKDDSLPLEINPLLAKIHDAVNAVSANRYYRLSWQQIMYGDGRVKTRRLVLLKPMMNFAEFLPAEQSLSAIRQIIDEMESTYPELKIRITGEVALEHEELESVSQGAAWAGLFSFVLVFGSLFIGFRSLTLVFATLMSLTIGLLLTAGFATVAVGHLNLISIAFAVLYIGLGVDYAVHLCLRYRNCVESMVPNAQAITDSIRAVGPSIILCAVTTAIGLYAFIPTDYSGVSELGLIAGTGMFIGLVVTLSVLPAILTLVPVKAVVPLGGALPSWLYSIPSDFGRMIKGLSLLLILLATMTLMNVQFDSNPVNLRDPHSESVATFRQLLKSADDSPFALTLLSGDAESAKASASRLEDLATVKSAITLFDFISDDQQEKLSIIEDLGLLLGSDLDAFDREMNGQDNRQDLEIFVDRLDRAIATGETPPNGVLVKLRDGLGDFIQLLDQDPEQGRVLLDKLEKSALGTLPISMNSIRNGFQAEAFGLQDLPKELYGRWVSPEGIYRIQIIPEHDLNDPENLKQFAEQVQTIEPNAVGLPVADRASGKAVVLAFKQAFIGALSVIGVLLLIILRSFKDTLLVLFPLLLAGALTGAATVLLDSPFNFANIIALPLLLGLGVDNCIHIVHRLRTLSGKDENLLRTSTARGIFFSSLTTLFSFSSLAFTNHVGTASMGLLLTVGIVFTLMCTLIVLPAFTGIENPKTV